MTENCDPLDLLLAAFEEVEKTSQTLKDTNLFEQETNLPRKPLVSTAKNSLIHTGDTDSSDDEDSRNWEERKYSENGRDIKKLLDGASSSSIRVGSSGSDSARISHLSNWKKPPVVKEKFGPTISLKLAEPAVKNDVYTDPIFGLRIINPLVSSSVLKDRMLSREAVTFSGLNRFLQINTKNRDWVLAGVIVSKTGPKTSAKGNRFSLWTLSDLKDDIKTVTLFLFGAANEQLWKTVVGTVVGILNPDVLEKKKDQNEASLSINNAQKAMIFGQSKDFGICKSMKKNGDKCTAIVNVNRCEYCIYHIKQEYQKCTIRSDLQSTFGGKGLTALRNKVLGKNEVFYAGKSYMAIPAKRSKKLEKKDNDTLNSLSGMGTVAQRKPGKGPKKKSAPRLDVPLAQRKKDLELLQKLSGTSDLSEKNKFEGKQSSEITGDDAKNLALSVLSKLKAKQQNLAVKSAEKEAGSVLEAKRHNLTETGAKSSVTHHIKDHNYNISPETSNKKDTDKNSDFPTLKDKHVDVVKQLVANEGHKNKLLEAKIDLKDPGPFSGPRYTFPKLSGFDSGSIDLSKPITHVRVERAKQKAINVIKKVGPIKKVDPNNLRGTGVKRPIDLDGKTDLEAKKIKLESSSFSSERFKKIMAAASAHQDLVEAREDEEKEKYFKKLETKEQMEQKMIGTHKLACKAVKCLQCKYTSFSASDLCKSERHPLKVFEATKRFYKCGNCQNRTVCLEVVPLRACNNCGSTKWEKTGMMKEKLVTATHSLSIRGGEQKSLNSVVSDTNVDLLVPD